MDQWLSDARDALAQTSGVPTERLELERRSRPRAARACPSRRARQRRTDERAAPLLPRRPRPGRRFARRARRTRSADRRPEPPGVRAPASDSEPPRVPGAAGGAAGGVRVRHGRGGAGRGDPPLSHGGVRRADPDDRGADLAGRGHLRLRDDLRGSPAGRGRRDRRRRAWRLRARPPSRPSRAPGAGDGLLRLQQRRDRRASRPGASSGSAASRSSTGTSTTATALRRSSGTTRPCSTCRCTSGRSIPAAAGRARATRRP